MCFLAFIVHHICVQNLDIPSVTITKDPQVAVESTTTIEATILSCPTLTSSIWQKNGSIDMDNFKIIDINDSKYSGSSDDPHCPRLVILKTAREDGIYYRLVVTNGVGQSTSNITYLKIIGGI
jgi:hypothetical protein